MITLINSIISRLETYDKNRGLDCDDTLSYYIVAKYRLPEDCTWTRYPAVNGEFHKGGLLFEADFLIIEVTFNHSTNHKVRFMGTTLVFDDEDNDETPVSMAEPGGDHFYCPYGYVTHLEEQFARDTTPTLTELKEEIVSVHKVYGIPSDSRKCMITFNVSDK
jgi:hypothetical protein